MDGGVRHSLSSHLLDLSNHDTVMSCKNCLSRRDFLARSAIAAAAVVVAEACGDGQIGPTSVSLGSGITINLADFPQLATTGVLVDVGHERAVRRTGSATFEAHSRVCTHEGCDTAVTNNRFECPCHGSIFAADGSVIRGPSTGESIGPLPQLAVQFNAADNTLTVQ
jgi:Rieske Fe-S protein